MVLIGEYHRTTRSRPSIATARRVTNTSSNASPAYARSSPTVFVVVFQVANCARWPRPNVAHVFCQPSARLLGGACVRSLCSRPLSLLCPSRVPSRSLFAGAVAGCCVGRGEAHTQQQRRTAATRRPHHSTTEHEHKRHRRTHTPQRRHIWTTVPSIERRLLLSPSRCAGKRSQVDQRAAILSASNAK